LVTDAAMLDVPCFSFIRASRAKVALPFLAGSLPPCQALLFVLGLSEWEEFSALRISFRGWTSQPL